MSKKVQNPFKEMEQSWKEAPPHLRKKVMDDIAMAKLISEMASLFTCNYKDTINDMLKTNSRNS